MISLFKEQEIIRNRYNVANCLLNDYMGSISIKAHTSHSSGTEPLLCTIGAYNDDSKLIEIVGKDIHKYYADKFNAINIEIKNSLSKLSEKNTKIISGFPGIGKSYFFRNTTDLLILDSDSSNFSWISKGIRHPDFPQNYINHIKANIGKVDIIFVSSHDVVRDALRTESIHYTLVYPDKSLKDDYIGRYIARGNDKEFINMINVRWDKFIDGCENDVFANTIKLKSGQYLCDALIQLNMED